MHPESVPGFRRLIMQARVSDPILLNERAMTRMVTHTQWILRRVGDSGIRLTAAGMLPPAVVVEATTELDWGWPVSVNRESHIVPLMELRTHLRDIGLLRVRQGMLLQTVKGHRFAESPRQLWWYLARTIHKSRKQVVSDATRLLLLFVATRTLDSDEECLLAVARGLDTIGWAEADGGAVLPERVRALVGEKKRLMDHLGVFLPNRQGLGFSFVASVGGAAFARAALQTEVPAEPVVEV